jgi:hypothetical protein
MKNLCKTLLCLSFVILPLADTAADYNPDLRLDQMNLYNSWETEIFQILNFHYDNNGSIMEITNSMSVEGEIFPRRRFAFIYNNDQLTEMKIFRILDDGTEIYNGNADIRYENDVPVEISIRDATGTIKAHFTSQFDQSDPSPIFEEYLSLLGLTGLFTGNIVDIVFQQYFYTVENYGMHFQISFTQQDLIDQIKIGSQNAPMYNLEFTYNNNNKIEWISTQLINGEVVGTFDFIYEAGLLSKMEFASQDGEIQQYLTLEYTEIE